MIWLVKAKCVPSIGNNYPTKKHLVSFMKS